MNKLKSYKIKKLNKTVSLDYPIEKIEGFKYVPKIKFHGDINEILIVDKELIDGLILASFDKKYKKILEYYLSALGDDESSSGDKLMLALDELARLRNIIIKKYQKTLSKKMQDKLLKKIKILENEIRIKVIDYKIIKEQERTTVEEKSHSR